MIEEELSFEADERVAPLVEEGHSETFGLVLVAGWPPNRRDMLEPYYRLKAAVELCFDESDVALCGPSIITSSSSSPPPVYIYPSTCLHVTVATLHSIHEQASGVLLPMAKQNQLKAAWTSVVRRASQLAEWPAAPLELVLASAQIGSRAGILLWNDTTGGIASMRRCIQIICNHDDDANVSPVDIGTMILPNIIHTTFLRFHRVPTTRASTVRERFRETVVPRLRDFFPHAIRVTTAALVCETVPFMHISSNDERVCLLNLSLSQSQEK